MAFLIGEIEEHLLIGDRLRNHPAVFPLINQIHFGIDRLFEGSDREAVEGFDDGEIGLHGFEIEVGMACSEPSGDEGLHRRDPPGLKGVGQRTVERGVGRRVG